MGRFLRIAWLLAAIVLYSAVVDRQAVYAGPQALFTFVFDDGDDTDYLVARDLFAEQGVVACSAITTDWINTSGYLSAEQVRGLRDAGWEILAHTATHPNLRSLTRAQVEEEFTRSKTALEGWGLTIRNLVYPYNKSNEMVREIASRYYRSARGGKNEFNNGIRELYDLRSFSNKRDLVKMKRYIDQAYEEKDWMIIYHHDITAKTTLTNKNGNFTRGELVHFSPSGAVGRHVRDNWFLSSGSMHFAPLSKTPQPGDRVEGQSSRTTARVGRIVFNERDSIAELLRYVRTRYPDMRVVTIDQGLDILGVPVTGGKQAEPLPH